MERAQAVLEELMSLSIEAGRKAAAEAAAGDRHAAGRLFAYHDVLDVLVEQAKLIGLVFEDKSLADFDPDELLQLKKAA